MLRIRLWQVGHHAIRTTQCRFLQQKTERSVNRVTLLGRIGQDAELKGSDEHPMVSFSLATSENIRSKQREGEGEFHQKTTWHRICVFRPGLLDAVYTYCKKGDRVFITGKIDYSEYTNSEGARMTQASIVADDVIFLGENRRSEYD